jgi:hypothetical protein
MMKRASARRAFSRTAGGIAAISAALLASSCATLGEPAGEKSASSPEEGIMDPIEFPSEDARLRPPSGDMYLLERKTEQYKKLQDFYALNLKKRYGALYVYVSAENPNTYVLPPIDDKGREQGDKSNWPKCDSKRNLSLTNFLSALFGVRSVRAATLTVKLTQAGSQEGSFINQTVPLLVYARDKNQCSIQFLATQKTLTPMFNPLDHQRLGYSFEWKVAKSDRVDLGNLLGTAAKIAGFTSMNATDGFASGLSEIAAANLNENINEFMSYFDVDASTKPFGELTYQYDEANPYNEVVFMVGRPSRDQATGAYKPNPNNPSFSLKLWYLPTLFSTCKQLDVGLGQCWNSMTELQTVLSSVKYNGSQLDALAAAPIGAGADGFFGGFVQKLQEASRIEAGADTTKRKRAAFSTICKELDAPTNSFKAYQFLNSFDRLVVKYALLRYYSDYLTDAALGHSDCFDEAAINVLQQNGTDTTTFRFPKPAAGNANAANELIEDPRAFARAVVDAFSANRDAIDLILASDASLEIGDENYVKGPHGRQIRGGAYFGKKDVSDVIRPDNIDLIGTAFCHQLISSRADAEKGASGEIGLWIRVRDEFGADGVRAAPVVLSFRAQGDGPALIDKIAIVSPDAWSARTGVDVGKLADQGCVRAEDRDLIREATK